MFVVHETSFTVSLNQGMALQSGKKSVFVITGILYKQKHIGSTDVIRQGVSISVGGKADERTDWLRI